MRGLRSILCGAAAALLLALPAQASTIALWTGPLDPSNLLSYFNTLITSINTTVTPATAGTGAISAAINTPAVSSAVNALEVTAGATGVGVKLSVGDSFGATSDSNIGIFMAGKGTGAAHLGGTTLANGSLRVPTVASAVNQFQISGAITTAEPIATVGGTASDTNIGIVLAGKGTGRACLAGSTCANSSLSAVTTASAVNQVVVTGAITTAPPSIVTGGSSADANVGMFIAGNGTGVVYVGGTTTTLAGLQVAQTASRVNAIAVTPSATGTVPSIGIGGAGADANRDLNVKAIGTGIVTLGQAVATCSGTTTATCQGQRFVASVTGLTTAAAGTTSAAMTVTNASVVSSSYVVHCQVNGYAGTGVPLVSTIIPGTGQVSFTITNVAGSGSLNATVPVACVVF